MKPVLSLITYINCNNIKFLDYIQSYIDNITSIEKFENYELVIVNVRSPATKQEDEILEPYIARHPNIKRIMVDSVSCQYDAWNIAIENSTGIWISNTNLDDRRSLTGTSELIDNIDNSVDVNYGHVMLEMDIMKILKNNLTSNIKYPARQISTLSELFCFNSPHCFPFWKRSIHDKIGLFDPRFTNVGDYELWIRGMKRHDIKFKYHDINIGLYYHSPDGLSTSVETRDAVATENRRMRMLYGYNIPGSWLDLTLTHRGLKQEYICLT